MTRSRHCFSYSDSGRKASSMLSAWWMFGVLAGAWIFRQAEPDLVTLKQVLCGTSPGFFTLLLCMLLPLAAAFVCIYSSAYRALFLICCVKAFAFSYVSCAVFAAFGGCGWLARAMLMFSDLVGTVVLYVFCFRCLSGAQKFTPGAMTVYPFCVFLIVFADYHFISPLLLRLLS